MCAVYVVVYLCGKFNCFVSHSTMSRSKQGQGSSAVTVLKCQYREVHTLPFQNLGNLVHPRCLCFGMSMKVVGPLYLVSMLGEVKYAIQGVNV